MFASRGDITAPCGVPTFVSDHSPSSLTPAFSHLWIRPCIRGSATRCWTNFSVHSWLMLSKDHTTHYPSSALSRSRDYHASASSLRGTDSGCPATGTHADGL